MGRGLSIPDEDKEYMLELYEKSIKKGYGMLATYGFIARAIGRPESTVKRIMQELNPTTRLATAKLKAASSKLVDRLIAKAEVPDIMDILSRPNIGVLAPAQKGGSSEGLTGVFVSVNQDSLGAVSTKVGVITGGETHGQGETRRDGLGGSPETQLPRQESVQQARLEAAQAEPRRPKRGRRGPQKVQRVQRAHGQPEAQDAEIV